MNLATWNDIIHQIYFLMAALFAVLLVRALFKRTTRKTIIYDIVYAYALIPFVLRALHLR